MSTSPRNGSAPASVRCAVYTRKSTEEGLEKEFTSLDAQREAAEAYVKSQAHAGWVCLPQRYDDPGYGGGTAERPALQRLLADVRAGRLDLVVVYKVDRLSRSLLDFARMMAVFEEHKVAFVSVTQQFNTASSMGRLVLNVLLSFAQFEREIIAERTRDKIAAARRKGKWVGGMPILGYDVDPQSSKLRVNAPEAERVRAIFGLYLEHKGLIPVVEELSRRGWVSKRWRTRKGSLRGGRPFTKAGLYHLLRNPAYRGFVRYKEELHQGEHEGLIDAATWRQVQKLLTENGRGRPGVRREPLAAPLKGLLRCSACDAAMVPVYTGRRETLRGRSYRCRHAIQSGRAACPAPLVPAADIEALVCREVSRAASRAEGEAAARLAAVLSQEALAPDQQEILLRHIVRRVDFEADTRRVAIALRPGAFASLPPEITPS